MDRKTIRAAKRHYVAVLDRALTAHPEYQISRNKRGDVTYVELGFRDVLHVPPEVRGDVIECLGNLLLLGERIRLGRDIADYVMEQMLVWKLRYKYHPGFPERCEEVYLALREGRKKRPMHSRKQ